MQKFRENKTFLLKSWFHDFFFAWSHFHTVTKFRKKSTQENKMLLLKNPQFLSNCYETLSKCPSNGQIQMAKYQLDWVKIVDFSLIASYFSGWTFFWIWSQCGIRIYVVRNVAIIIPHLNPIWIPPVVIGTLLNFLRSLNVA